MNKYPFYHLPTPKGSVTININEIAHMEDHPSVGTKITLITKDAEGKNIIVYAQLNLGSVRGEIDRLISQKD